VSKIDALESIRFLSLRLRDNLPPWCANYAELREKYSKLCALVGPDDESARVIGERLKYALRECEALSREAIERKTHEKHLRRDFACSANQD